MKGEVLTILLGLLLPVAYCLDCYQCDHITNLADCHTVVVCPSDTLCSMETASVGGNSHYNLTCKPKQECLPTPTFSPASIIGRRSTTDCSECCSKDACNKQLCSGTIDFSTGQCSDDPTLDCAHFSTYFNICADVSHAKSVCRRFCNLCSLVDGDWSAWSNWSRCDTTCGTGKIIRTRTCSEPAPANGGLDCAGTSKENSTCHLSPCPVAGGWSTWSSWTNCDVSCGVGLQKRRRTCSNPYPALTGNHCFGDGMDVKICVLNACNASSSWSNWEHWSNCSVSCGSGMQVRRRTCTSQTPTVGAEHCVGYDLDVNTCVLQSCLSLQVAFIASYPTGTLVGSSPTFRTITTNIGGGYNVTTGKFTSPVSGVYSFSVTLMASSTRTGIADVYCWMKKNAANLALVNTIKGSYDTTSTTIFTHLSVGDIFRLYCRGWTNVYTDWFTSFSGALIKAD